SFFSSARALALTALWSRTMSAAKARTSLLLDFLAACCAASMSIWPAVKAIWAICGSLGLAAPWAAAGLAASDRAKRPASPAVSGTASIVHLPSLSHAARLRRGWMQRDGKGSRSPDPENDHQNQRWK